MTPTRTLIVVLSAAALSTAACDDGVGDGADAGPGDDAGDAGDLDAGDLDGGDGGEDADLAPDAEGDAEPPGGDETTFLLRLENVSGGGFPTALSPGAWVAHERSDPLFVPGTRNRAEGLEALAEDGDPTELVASLEEPAGVFARATGAGVRGPALPGEVFEVEVTARPGQRLSFATMIAESNDLVIAPEDGIELFAEDGSPLGTRDLTSELAIWDVGTEADQAPRLGPNQPPRQPAPGTGSAEGVVRVFDSGTRTIPSPRDLVVVTVVEDAGAFTITIQNDSGDCGTMVTALSPMFFAVHDESFRLFVPGEPAGEGLEALAENGSAAELAEARAGAPGVLEAGVVATPLERPGESGPARPGESYRLTVEPDAAHRFLSFATMVMETNDVFLAIAPPGLVLMDESGRPRDAGQVEAELRRHLATWDAGTEANEVPGVGPNQAPRQAVADAGPPDPNPAVRLYDDATNDLAGPFAGGFVELEVVGAAEGAFEVRLTNRSHETAYLGSVGPLVHALHDGTARLFEPGRPASAALERLAEDGRPLPLVEALEAQAGVVAVAVADRPEGASGPALLPPGASYLFTVTPDETHRWLLLAAMLMPSNDTFVALPAGGIELIDEIGARRTDAQIGADLEALVAWDAGTEVNEAGAAGADQAPRQDGSDTGAAEGAGLVVVEDGVVWSYPHVRELIRVTIAPAD